MFGFYTPVLLLQAFCIYHAYKNNAESRWYWFILLFSVFGCAFYLYENFYSRRNLSNISETMKAVVNTNYRLERLEQAHKFSDNLTNTVNLADAYAAYGRYDEAIHLYRSAATGFMADDPGLQMKMLQAHFLHKDYKDAIDLGERLASQKVFTNAEQRIAYALALHGDGKTQDAEKVFNDLDRSYTNYPHRLAYCRFLLETGRSEEMQRKAVSILEELEHMKGPERKLHRGVMNDLRSLYSAAEKK